MPRKLLPERNVVVYYTEFDEFKEELERCHWDEEDFKAPGEDEEV